MASTAVCKTTTRQATGHLKWEIDGWTGLCDKVGISTTSETMQCVGHSWHLMVYPGGYEAPFEHVTVYLCYTGSSEALRTGCSITIVNQLPGLRA